MKLRTPKLRDFSITPFRRENLENHRLLIYTISNGLLPVEIVQQKWREIASFQPYFLHDSKNLQRIADTYKNYTNHSLICSFQDSLAVTQTPFSPCRIFKVVSYQPSNLITLHTHAHRKHCIFHGVSATFRAFTGRAPYKHMALARTHAQGLSPYRSEDAFRILQACSFQRISFRLAVRRRTIVFAAIFSDGPRLKWESCIFVWRVLAGFDPWIVFADWIYNMIDLDLPSKHWILCLNLKRNLTIFSALNLGKGSPIV